MNRIFVGKTANIVRGHVLDVAKAPLERALRRYDPLLYLTWNPKKQRGLGVWELRRRPEFRTIQQGRIVESPRGNVSIPGNIFEFDGGTLCVPKYIENSFENHVKDFQRLSYDIVRWVADHDLWNYGFKGKDTTKEAEYREAKWLEREDEKADSDRQYMIRQEKTNFKKFGEYLLSGGNPADLIGFWPKN